MRAPSCALGFQRATGRQAVPGLCTNATECVRALTNRGLQVCPQARLGTTCDRPLVGCVYMSHGSLSPSLNGAISSHRLVHLEGSPGSNPWAARGSPRRAWLSSENGRGVEGTLQRRGRAAPHGCGHHPSFRAGGPQGAYSSGGGGDEPLLRLEPDSHRRLARLRAPAPHNSPIHRTARHESAGRGPPAPGGHSLRRGPCQPRQHWRAVSVSLVPPWTQAQRPAMLSGQESSRLCSSAGTCAARAILRLLQDKHCPLFLKSTDAKGL